MPLSLGDAQREREAQHRAELALLVSRVVPQPRPAVDLLISRALPAAAEPLAAFGTGHDERSLDFWDERKLAGCVKHSEQRDILELTQNEVDEVKAVRRAFLLATKRPARELEQPELTGQCEGRQAPCRKVGRELIKRGMDLQRLGSGRSASPTNLSCHA